MFRACCLSMLCSVISVYGQFNAVGGVVQNMRRRIHDGDRFDADFRPTVIIGIRHQASGIRLILSDFANDGAL